MNWDQIQGNWKQVTGKARAMWGDITDDELTKIAGRKDELVGMIQTRYGVEKEEAERQVKKFADTLH